MVELFKLAGVITIDGLKTAQKDIGKFEASVRKAVRPVVQLGRQAETAGKVLTKNLTLPIVALNAAVIKFGGDFQKSMATSTAIMSDVTDEMRKDMSELAKEMSTKTTHSASELAKAYYYLASAGLSAEQSLKALPVAAHFAEAGQFDLQMATDLLTDAQSALGMTVKDAAQNMENMTIVSDVLVKGATMANATVEQFSLSLTNKAGPALRVVNKGIEEGVAVLAAFADQGVKGEEAGTQLAIVLRDLQRAALKEAAAFEQMGIAVYDDNETMRNVGDIIADIEKAFEGMTDKAKKSTLAMLGFQERSVQSLLTLIGTSQKIKEYESNLKNAAGTTEEVTKKQLQNFNDQVKIMYHRLQNVAIELADEFLPILQEDFFPIIISLVEKLKELLAYFKSLPPDIKKLTFTLMALVAVAGPALIIFGKFAGAIATLPALIAGAKIATAGLGAAISAVPFAIAAVAVVAFGKKILDLQKEYHDLKKVHTSTMKLFESDKAAKIDDFNNKFETLTGGINNYIKATGKLSPEVFEAFYSKPITDMAKVLKELGYTIEGTTEEQFFQAQEIYNQINNVTKLDQIYQYFTQTKKAANEVTKKSIKLTQKEIDELQRLAEEKEIDAWQAVEEEKSANFQREKTQKENTARLKKFEKDMQKYREQMLIDFTNLNKSQSEQRIQYFKDEQAEKLKLAGDNEKLRAEINQYYDKQIYAVRMQRAEDWINFSNDSIQQTIGLFQGMYDNRAIAIDNDYKKQKKSIEDSTMKEKDKKEALAKLDDEFDKKRASLRRKQAIAEKASAIFSIGLNTAAAVVRALFDPGGIAGYILSGIMGALGAAQLAIAASKPIPEFAEGGVLKSRPGGQMVRAAENGEDEGFIPMTRGTASIAQAIIDNMRRFSTGNEFAGGGALSAAGAGGGINLHIGTFIGNEKGIKDLTRRIIPYINAEDRRKGTV